MPASNFVAGGTINPACFVKVSTAADNTVLQSGAGDWSIGIASPSQKLAPIPSNSSNTYAAQSGDQIMVFGLGEICNVLASTAGFTHGDKLKSDANGNAVTASSGDYVAAVALESVTGQALGRVIVMASAKL